MKDYTKIEFKGEFRHYQQRVLDQADDFLTDGKIHIVAAPGSGKTTLGLELIKRLNEPALIFTPTITIRGQWGHRLESGFLDFSENIEDYISYDLKKPKLITSITYQALHSAYKKLINNEIDDETNEEIIEDYTKYNLISSLKKANIKTICLDEAHHLRNEWYIALSSVIKELGEDIKIIALTATPPYDSSQQEWAKYEELCGEIDEEIFVPELIRKNALCPHQDYIYFNYPTKEEMALLSAYKQNVSLTIDEMIKSKAYKTLLTDFIDNYNDEKYQFYQNIEVYITLMYLSRHAGYKIPSKLLRLVKGSRYIKKLKPNYVEDLFNFIIKNEDIFTTEISIYFKNVLNEKGLLERGKASFDKSSKVKKRVISSIGKLESIAAISKFEYNQLQDSLQMVILTDYIKKDYVKDIGTTKKFTSIGTVPIFEKVRTSLPGKVRICLLSGTLVILPNNLIEVLRKKAEVYQIQIDARQIANVDYSVISFIGSNKKKVFIITQLFNEGYIDILVGTKSLLGEGWDSPYINTLILASFVGSFMLSNQMRGRAIRLNPSNPNKVASIWHLATIEPTSKVGDIKDVIDISNYIEESHYITSTDFDLLKRRFETFIGPAYEEDYIASGIERIDYIQGPYHKDSFDKFNEVALTYASNRQLVKSKWDEISKNEDYMEIVQESVVDNAAIPYGMLIYDLTLEFIFTTFMIQFTIQIGKIGLTLDKFIDYVYLLAVILFVSYTFQTIPRIILNLGPSKKIKTLSKAVLNTLRDIGEVKSPHAIVTTKKYKSSKVSYLSLSNASRHDKAVFTNAIKELLSHIENPRYIIVRNVGFGRYPIPSYSETYSVPKLIGLKKEFVEIFQSNLKRSSGNFMLIYTHSEKGRKALLKARRTSRLNMVKSLVLSKRVVVTESKK